MLVSSCSASFHRLRNIYAIMAAVRVMIVPLIVLVFGLFSLTHSLATAQPLLQATASTYGVDKTSAYWLEARLLSPVQDQVVGHTSFFSLQIYNYSQSSRRRDDQGHGNPLPSNILLCLQLRISLNGHSIYDQPLAQSVLECTIGGEHMVPGQNTISVEIQQRSTGTDEGLGIACDQLKNAGDPSLFVRKTITVVSKQESNQQLASIIEMTRSDPEAHKYLAYLFVGMHDRITSNLAQLEAERVVLVKNFTVTPSRRDFKTLHCNSSELGADAEKWQSYPFLQILCGIRYVDHLQSLDSLSEVSYGDHAFVVLNEIIQQSIEGGLECAKSSLSSLQAVRTCTASVMEALLSLVRGSIWIFAESATDPNGVNTVDESIAVLKDSYQFQQVFFRNSPGGTSVDSSENSKEEEVLPGITAWVRVVNLETCCGHMDALEDSFSSSAVISSHVQERATDNDGTARESDVTVSRVISESFVNGRSHILLEHGCFSPDLEAVVLLSSSGTPLINETFLAEDEDRGFLYTGLQLLEVPARSEDAHHIKSSWKLFKGVTAMTFSVQGGHIVHELEPLVQLLYAAHTIRRHSEAALHQLSGNRTQAPALRDLSGSFHQTFIFMAGSLKRMVLSKVNSINANPWVLQMARHILNYVRQEVFAATEILAAHCQSDSSSQSVSICSLARHQSQKFRVVALVTMDHLKEASRSHEDSELAAGVCFERLLLLGRSNSHVRLFGSEHVAESFKHYLYDRLFIRKDVVLPKIIPPIRRLPLKVTIALRPGPSRLILNLPEVVEWLNSQLFIDSEWLLSHIFPFENLLFNEQVEIMANTDIFLAVHGAAIMNCIFMQRGSVAIDVFTGRYVEYFYAAPLRESGVRLLYVFNSAKPNSSHGEDHSYCSSKGNSIPLWCYDVDPLEAADINCFNIRQCSGNIGLEKLKLVVKEAQSHVLSAKYAHLYEEY